MTVLDYCAGGGGKALALAAAMPGRGRLLAWDANPRRMADLPDRARRAGAQITILSDGERAALRPVCDLVLVDAPVLGHRRLAAKARGQVAADPGGARELPAAAGRHARRGGGHVEPGGLWSTPPARCLARENEERAAAFAARHPGWLPRTRGG